VGPLCPREGPAVWLPADPVELIPTTSGKEKGTPSNRVQRAGVFVRFHRADGFERPNGRISDEQDIVKVVEIP